MNLKSLILLLAGLLTGINLYSEVQLPKIFSSNMILQQGKPLGIISTSWGGTMVEEWIPSWAYEGSGIIPYQ
jgi:hypothetical protein